MLLNCVVGVDSWETLGQQGDPTNPSWDYVMERKSVLNIHWKDWCWSWNSNTWDTWCEELTHWKRPWWWERLKVGGEGDDRGWDGWMASLTQWIWVWATSSSWWWTGKPGVCSPWSCKESDMTEQLNRLNYLPPEKPLCRSTSNSSNLTWNNWSVEIKERSKTRLYIVTLFV